MLLPVILAVLILCAAKKETVLNVALYPYVPDQTRFQQSIEAAWSELHPEIELNFVSWDCYAEDPTEDLDLFVYDAAYLYDFLERGYLLPLSKEDIRDADDFFPYALSACQADGITYALPQLLCTNLLYVREDDTEMKAVNNVYDLYQIIDDERPTDPANGAGLLVLWPDAVTLALWYLEIKTDLEQTYSEWFVCPDRDDLDPEVLEILDMVQTMSAEASTAALVSDGSQYPYGTRFADGYGRAFIGYSEDMYAMGNEAENVAFRRFSLSDEEDIPMVYADIASINAKIPIEKRELALELLNIITGKETLVEAFSPAEDNQFPQYLLGARAGIYDELAEDYPIYGELKAIVSDPSCRVVLFRPSGRDMTLKAADVFKPFLLVQKAG